MSSIVSIVNRALIEIGESAITSLSDRGKPAEVMSALWAPTRDSELRKAHWNFAIERTTLAANTTPPAFNYSKAYTLPSDFLRAVEVGDGPINAGAVDLYYAVSYTAASTDPHYRIEGDSIVTNEGAPLKLRYVRRVENVGLYDALFEDVLVCALAMQGGPRIAALTAGDKELLARKYSAVVAEARRIGSIEQAPGHRVPGPWAAARWS